MGSLEAKKSCSQEEMTDRQLCIYMTFQGQSGLQGEIWEPWWGVCANEQNAKPGAWERGEQMVHSVKTKTKALIDHYNPSDLHRAQYIVDAQ